MKTPSVLPEAVSCLSPKAWLVCGLFAALLALPAVAHLGDQAHYLTLGARVAVFGIAALSLNLLVGFSGLISLGHAMYLAIGAYAAAIPLSMGLASGWLHLAVAVLASLGVALPAGLVALRTTGMSFIMITLAFAQMFFYLMVSLRVFGGDDGMSLTGRSDFGLLSLADPDQLYFACIGLLTLAALGSTLLFHSRMGYVLRGARQNPRRLEALGLDVFRHRLAAYLLSALLAALAGVLFANLNGYVSPSYAAWTLSGDLVLMVVLGGMHTVLGPLVGATFLILFESIAPSLGEHWMLPYGLSIVAIVMLTRHGLYGALLQRLGGAGGAR